MHRLIAILIVIVFALSACGGRPASRDASESTTPMILTSTTFLADIARNVAGDRVAVESLLSPGADPHEYQAVPSDVQKITTSTMLIINGLDYDEFIQPLLENASGTRLVVTASDGLEPREMQEETGETVTDPHMWMAPTRVVKYVENIRD